MNRKNQQRGFSIVTAIFIMVIMGMLGAYMVSISGVQRTTSSYALLGASAYKAAGSGVQWAIYQAFNDTAATCGGAPSTTTIHTFTPAGAGLNGFNVTATCSYTRHQEGGSCFYLFFVTAKAEYGTYGGPDYISRRVQATASDLAAPISGCP